MTECRCGYCNRYLFSYEFKDMFHLTIKCPGCCKVNVYNFAKFYVTVTSLTLEFAGQGQT